MRSVTEQAGVDLAPLSPKLLGPVHTDLRHDLGKRCPGEGGVLTAVLAHQKMAAGEVFGRIVLVPTV